MTFLSCPHPDSCSANKDVGPGAWDLTDVVRGDPRGPTVQRDRRLPRASGVLSVLAVADREKDWLALLCLWGPQAAPWQ